jgi:hypothetical protein
VAGVGWARLGGEISSRVRLPFVGLALALVLAAGSLPWIIPRINLLRIEGRMAIHESHINANIDDAVRLAGGGDRVRRCGGVFTGPFEVPVLAHQLNVHFSGVALDPRAPGTVFQTRVTPASPLGPRVPAGFRYVGAAGPWRVYTTCAS